MQMKYIRYDILGIIIFESHIKHSTMNDVINPLNYDIISAGFVSVNSVGDDIEVITGMGSESLKVKSKPEDAELIKRRLCLY